MPEKAGLTTPGDVRATCSPVEAGTNRTHPSSNGMRRGPDREENGSGRSVVAGTGAQCRRRNTQPPPRSCNPAPVRRRLVGQLRKPDGTWIEHDRNRLRQENETFSSSGIRFCDNKTNFNGDETTHGQTSRAPTSVACRRCSATGREGSGSPTGMERRIDWAELCEQAGILARRGPGGATTTTRTPTSPGTRTKGYSRRQQPN